MPKQPHTTHITPDDDDDFLHDKDGEDTVPPYGSDPETDDRTDIDYEIKE